MKSFRMRRLHVVDDAAKVRHGRSALYDTEGIHNTRELRFLSEYNSVYVIIMDFSGFNNFQ